MDAIKNFRSNYNNCISVYIPNELSLDAVIDRLNDEMHMHTNECIVKMIGDIKNLVIDTRLYAGSLIIFMHPHKFYVFTNNSCESYKFIIDNKFYLEN